MSDLSPEKDSARDASSEVHDRVADAVRHHGLFEDVRHVYVGFSGGADSTACLLLTRKLHDSVAAVHLNHGLRGAAADRDEAWCRAFCEIRNIPFESHHLAVSEAMQAGVGRGLEATARDCRLRFWRERVESGAVVALGHHADDCLEELLLRMARGANCTGLTGLRHARTVEGVCFVRPLLDVRRSELQAFLREEGVTDWCEDRTNLDTAHRRNAVRHDWLGAIRNSVGHLEGLHHTLAALRHDAGFLEAAAMTGLREIEDGQGAFRDLHPALFPRVLRLWLREETGHDLIVSGATLARLQEELERASDYPVDVPVGGGVVVVVSSSGLRVRESELALAECCWNWRREPCLSLVDVGLTLTAAVCPRLAPDTLADSGHDCELFDAEALPERLTVRGWRAGDRMVPFGARSPKKLQDIFVNTHVPRERRHGVPLLLAGNEIIWAAGICRAEYGRIAVPPANVVRLTLALASER